MSHLTPASNKGQTNSSFLTGPPPQLPRTTPIYPQHAPIPLWFWANLLREGYTRCPLAKVISRLTTHGTMLMPTCPARCALGPNRPSNMPSCPAPPPPLRDPASSKGSQTWPPRPRSGPTSSCSLRWLRSFAPPQLVCLLECPRLLPPCIPPSKPPPSIYPPIPPWPSRLDSGLYFPKFQPRLLCDNYWSRWGNRLHLFLLLIVDLIFGFVLAISLKMHVITSTVETMNI